MKKWKQYLHMLDYYLERCDLPCRASGWDGEYVTPPALQGYRSVSSFRHAVRGRAVSFGEIHLFGDEDISSTPILSKIGTSPRGDLYLQRDSGQIILFQENGTLMLGDFHRFIDHHAFGEGYLLFKREDEVDIWYEFLVESGAIPS